MTGDGFETTFAVNHIAPFLLTTCCLDLLSQNAPSRVVTVTSTAFRRGRIDFDDLQAERRISTRQSSWTPCCLQELACRLKGTGVTANCVHPGVVRGTGLGHGERFPLPIRVSWTLLRRVMKSP